MQLIVSAHANCVICVKDLGNRDENFPTRTLQPELPGRNFLDKMASLSQHNAKNGILFVLYVCISTLGVCELALLVKLQESTKLRPPRTIQVYVLPFWLRFFGFHPGRPG